MPLTHPPVATPRQPFATNELPGGVYYVRMEANGNRRSGRMERVICALAVATGMVGASVAGAAVPVPDLCVPRDGLVRDGDRVTVVVENRGDAPAPATVVELWDRPPLEGPVGCSSPYPPGPTRRGVWITQEQAGDGTIALGLHLGRDRALGAYAGELRRLDEGVLRPVDERPDVTFAPDGRFVRWEATAVDGGPIRLLVPGAPGRPPTVELRLVPDDEPSIPTIHVAGPDLNTWTTRLELQALDREPARRTRVDVPALAPGERARVAATHPAGRSGDTFAIVDPDGTIREAREGNNVTSVRADADRRAQCALHLHSSFSEGEGSVDWQVDLGARSGYDLLWWTEHDWRISCLDHVERFGFEPDDAGELRFPGRRGSEAIATIDEDDAATGAASLRLAVPPGSLAPAVARVRPDRRRLAYVLASDVELSLAVRATALGPGDRLRVIVELSEHRDGQRDIEYVLRAPGASPLPSDPPGAPVAHRALEIAGGWTRVILDVSRDAEAAWPNGLDNSVTGLELRLEAGAGGDGAEVRVDELRVRHERCGDALRAVQERWMEEYPNVAHAFGEEISYLAPHLNQYGGPRGLVDYAAAWEEAYVEKVVERVHRAGGLVSWCHPFGVSLFAARKGKFDAAYRDSLLAAGFGGTDLLEVGFRKKASAPLADYLDYWDRAGARGIAITGIGVSDSHGRDWGSWENDFATWVDAPAGDPDVVLRALKAGRAVFGDPLGFRGRLAIESEGARPGDEVSGASPRRVVVTVTDAPAGSSVRLVLDGVSGEPWPVAEGEGSWSVDLPAGSARVARAELWGAGARPLAFTNPIRFRPAR